jgi:TRAP-type transport system periplasmic protein
MKLSLRAAFAWAFLVLAFTAWAPPASAAEFEWRFQNNWVDGRWESKMLAAFAERVNERSKGRLKITVFNGGALGIKQGDHLQALKSGAVHMAVLYPGYLARDVPDVADALPNGVVFSDEEAVKMNPTLEGIYRAGYSRWNTTVVGWLNTPPYRLSIFCKEPIRTLDALKGKKLRVWVKDVIDPFNALGIPAQLMPQEELYVALQTGVVDCAVYSIAIAKTISLQEVAKYAAPMFTLSGLSALGVSNRHWQKLPKDLQAVVLEAGDWLYKQTNVSAVETARKLETDAAAELTASGKLVVLEPFSAADKKRFYDDVIKHWAQRTQGPAEEQTRKRVQAALEATRAK